MFVGSREIFLLYCCQSNQDWRFITNKPKQVEFSLMGEDTVMMLLCYSKRPISPILLSL